MTMYLYQLPPKVAWNIWKRFSRSDYVLVNKFIPKSENIHEALEEMFCCLNQPDCYEYNHRSMSVNDVVVVEQNGKSEVYLCDYIGFTKIEW